MQNPAHTATSAADSSWNLSYTAAALSLSPWKRTSLNSVPAPTKPGATTVVRTFLSYVYAVQVEASQGVLRAQTGSSKQNNASTNRRGVLRLGCGWQAGASYRRAFMKACTACFDALPASRASASLGCAAVCAVGAHAPVHRAVLVRLEASDATCGGAALSWPHDYWGRATCGDDVPRSALDHAWQHGADHAKRPDAVGIHHVLPVREQRRGGRILAPGQAPDREQVGVATAPLWPNSAKAWCV